MSAPPLTIGRSHDRYHYRIDPRSRKRRSRCARRLRLIHTLDDSEDRLIHIFYEFGVAICVASCAAAVLVYLSLILFGKFNQ